MGSSRRTFWIAVCCSVLQCVAACCAACFCVLQRIYQLELASRAAPEHSRRQCVAECCSMLQFICQWQLESRAAPERSRRQCVAVCCSMLQYVAVCCSTLQYVAVRCSMLQYVAVCCSIFTNGHLSHGQLQSVPDCSVDPVQRSQIGLKMPRRCRLRIHNSC